MNNINEEKLMENITQIASILGLEAGLYNQTQIKEIYRKLASKYHPDKEFGDTNKMQLINASYEKLEQFFKTSDTLELKNNQSIFDFALFDELKALPGLIIEVCGHWIWLKGNTKEHKEILKKLGFKYSFDKGMWFWSVTLKPNSKIRGSKTMVRIRKLFGSTIITTESHELALLK